MSLKQLFVGHDIGPQITVSNSIFKKRDILEYTCIENSDYEANILARVLDDGSVVRFGKWYCDANEFKTIIERHGHTCKCIPQHFQLVT